MGKGRHRVRVRVAFPPFVQAEWEWIGFRSAGTFGNLDTAIVHEVIPVIADNTVGIQAFTVHRLVGSIQVRQQAGVVTTSTLGIMIGVEDAGADQTSDNPLLPLTTDIDHLAHKGIMWSWTGIPSYGVELTAADDQPMTIPIDIKVKRIVSKRERLVISLEASSTGRIRVACNVRALIKEAAGS